MGRTQSVFSGACFKMFESHVIKGWSLVEWHMLKASHGHVLHWTCWLFAYLTTKKDCITHTTLCFSESQTYFDPILFRRYTVKWSCFSNTSEYRFGIGFCLSFGTKLLLHIDEVSGAFSLQIYLDKLGKMTFVLCFQDVTFRFRDQCFYGESPDIHISLKVMTKLLAELLMC